MSTTDEPQAAYNTFGPPPSVANTFGPASPAEGEYLPIEFGTAGNIEFAVSAPPTDTPAPTGGETNPLLWSVQLRFGKDAALRLIRRARYEMANVGIKAADASLYDAIDALLGMSEPKPVADAANCPDLTEGRLATMKRLLDISDACVGDMIDADDVRALVGNVEYWRGASSDAIAEATTLRARLQEETRAAAEAKERAESEFEEGARSGNMLLLWALRYCQQEEIEYLFDKLSRRTEAGKALVAAADANESGKLALHEEMRGLRADHATRGKQLHAALLSLADMWDQYCPPPHTHMFMSAGEDAAEVLLYWGLLPNGEFAEAINSYDGTPMPAMVQALLESRGLAKDLGADLTQFNEKMAAALPLQGEEGKEAESLSNPVRARAAFVAVANGLAEALNSDEWDAKPWKKVYQVWHTITWAMAQNNPAVLEELTPVPSPDSDLDI